MKEIIKEFLELLGYCVLVVCFLFTSYLLLINLYHYRELSVSQQRDLATEINYTKFKTTITSIEESIASIDYSKLSNTQVSAATLIKDGINGCITAIEASDFYKLSDKKVIVMKDVYDANKELYNVLNNKCLFFIPYYIEGTVTSYGANHSIINLKATMDSDKERVSEYSSYLLDTALNNSSYHYSTNVSRYTIYNELNTLINLTVNNYNQFAESIKLASDWYVSEYGGNK